MKITFSYCFEKMNNGIMKLFDLIATPLGGILGVLVVLRLPFEINANHFALAWLELVFFMLFMVAAFSGHSRYTYSDYEYRNHDKDKHPV